MDHVRNFLTRLKTGHHGGDENDDNILSGPNIGISPGQVKEDVHYMESRGSIDLSTLRFHAEEYPKKTQSNLNLRIPSNSTQEIIVGNNPVGYESIVDIAVFQVPEHCNSQNCDLSKVRLAANDATQLASTICRMHTNWQACLLYFLQLPCRSLFLFFFCHVSYGITIMMENQMCTYTTKTQQSPFSTESDRSNTFMAPRI